MIRKIRDRHIKKVLWILVLIIVPSFLLWGSISYFKEKQLTTVGEIRGRRIDLQEFREYYALAHLNLLWRFGKNFYRELGPQAQETQAWHLLLLLQKAKEENIEVSDEELMDYIKKNLFGEKPFSQELYLRLVKGRLRMGPRLFEERMRKILTVEKLIKKLIGNQEVDEKYLREAFRRDTQKARISYIVVPYAGFKEAVAFDDAEIERFYKKNKEDFKEPSRVKIKYIFFKQGTLSPSYLEDLKKHLATTQNIDELGHELSLDVIESDYISLESPLESIGWNKEVNALAFSLVPGEMSPLTVINDKGYILMQGLEKKEAFVPALKSIERAVREKLLGLKTKKLAQQSAEDLLKEIKEKKETDLGALAARRKQEFKETGYFKYYDYIEGVGLGENISSLIFNLEKGSIHPEVLLLAKGAYLIQLADIDAFDEEGFNEQRETYRQKAFFLKREIAYQKLLKSLSEEFDLKIYSSPQQ